MWDLTYCCEPVTRPTKLDTGMIAALRGPCCSTDALSTLHMNFSDGSEASYAYCKDHIESAKRVAALNSHVTKWEVNYNGRI